MNYDEYIDCVIRRKLCYMLILKSSCISQLNAHIANTVIEETVGDCEEDNWIVRQYLAKAQLIRPEIVSNVINSSGMDLVEMK